MFKVIADPQFVEDVRVETPDGDTWITQTLRTRFRVLPDAEVQALLSGDGSATSDMAAMLARAVVGFLDVTNDAGQQLDGMGALRDQLLGFRHIQLALIKGYSGAVLRHALGNSASSAAAGPPVH